MIADMYKAATKFAREMAIVAQDYDIRLHEEGLLTVLDEFPLDEIFFSLEAAKAERRRLQKEI